MPDEKAVVDADFTKLLCSLSIENCFIRFMSAVGKSPIMAWYVADSELFACPKAIELIKQGDIEVVYPEDFLTDDLSRQIFDNNVRSFAEAINGEIIPTSVDIFSKGFHLSGKNLGEIISELMAKELDIELFVSNDWGAKRYVETYINSSNYELKVKNVAELCEIIAAQKNKDLFKWKEIKSILHDKRWKDDITKLKAFWVSD